MKRAVMIFAALGFALFVPATHAGRGLAVAATPTPAALQYDELNRPMIPPATPPPPGTFQEDYQAAVNAGPPKRGFAAMINPEAVLAQISRGHVERYTYYKGWIRMDDAATQQATIEKCDQHQFIALNYAAKTYTVTNTQPPCPPAMPMGAGMGRGGNSSPGTMDMTVKSTSQPLGPLTIEGIATEGSDNSVELSMTNATGSCHNGDFSMKMTRYVSRIAVPRPYCPLPKSMTLGGIGGMMAQGGCTPTMRAQAQGMGESDSRNLVLYSRMTIGSNGAAANAEEQRMMAGMTLVTERGNVKWIGAAEAEPLFTIPSGFQQK